MRAPEESPAKAGECRRCRSTCDKLIDPMGCVEIGCRYLYSYEDQLSGEVFLGCVNKVFKGEIEVESVLEGNFGAIKMTGDPLPQCQFTIERAYEGAGPEYECVNRRFFDYDGDSEAIRAFDLRDALRP